MTMWTRPLFWLFAFFLFQVLVYLINRIGIRQHERFQEILWILFFILALVLPSAFFCRAWNFTAAGFGPLPLRWRFFAAVVAVWVLALWIDHAWWLLYRRKKVDFRLISRNRVKMPAALKPPFPFLSKIGFRNQLYDLEVAEYELTLPGWPREFSGMTLVQLSDLHLGHYINRDYLTAVMEKARGLKPDLYALTGDFISFAKDIPLIQGILRGFEAPLGVFAVLGNHDLWADGPLLKRALEEDGIRVLRNEVVYLARGGKSLAIMGADDIWVGERDDRPILEARADAKILLAHQPDHFYLAEKSGANLQLSGHCHGGQICFPILGPLVVPADEGRKYAGGFIREGDTTLFIHRGVGCYPPLRTYCPPEIVKLTLISG